MQTHSRPVRPSGLALWAQRIEELRIWTEANSEIAAAWDEAWAEDDLRAQARVRQDAERRMADTAPQYLLACGAGELEAAKFRAGLFATDAREAAARFVKGDKLILLLHGGTGAGKTIAACEALLLARNPRAPHTPNGRFATADQLARLSYYDGEAYEPLCRAPWLVLDDLGTEQGSSTFTATLDGLTNERVRHARRTVITSNLALKAFSDKYAPMGSRLASRLAQVGMVAGAGTNDLRRAS